MARMVLRHSFMKRADDSFVLTASQLDSPVEAGRWR